MPDSRLTNHPLIAMIDEITRMHGRVKTAFINSRDVTGLSEMEMTLLNAVAEAKNPPTVSQIGRSLGHPRQVIQRAANALIEKEMITSSQNPDHKRSPLLHATSAGRKLKDRANKMAHQTAESLIAKLDESDVRLVTAKLSDIRRKLEAQIREGT